MSFQSDQPDLGCSRRCMPYQAASAGLAVIHSCTCIQTILQFAEKCWQLQCKAAPDVLRSWYTMVHMAMFDSCIAEAWPLSLYVHSVS